MASKDFEEGVVDPAVPPTQTPTSDGNKYDLKWGFALDLDYIKSPHGILTAAITILSLIAFICGAAGRNDYYCDYTYGGGYSFFGFVSMSAFLTGLLNYILYIFTFYNKLFLKFVPWNLAWMIWCGVWCFFYLVGSSVVAAYNCDRAGNSAAAVFGFVVLLMVGVLGFLSFRRFQEERADKQTGPQSSASSPEYSAERNMEQY